MFWDEDFATVSVSDEEAGAVDEIDRCRFSALPNSLFGIFAFPLTAGADVLEATDASAATSFLFRFLFFFLFFFDCCNDASSCCTEHVG